jgi:hypothetical protein
VDDLVFVTRDVNTLKQMYLELEREIPIIGLSVNEREDKVYDSINIRAQRRPKFISWGKTF